jgi:hypothetical protein
MPFKLDIVFLQLTFQLFPVELRFLGFVMDGRETVTVHTRIPISFLRIV